MPLDHFALFRIPRRPWLEPEALKEIFHRLTVLTHPDRTGQAGDSAEVNAAYTTLREPMLRLRHLLELEEPARLAEPAIVTPALAEVFMRVGTLQRTAGAFLERLSRATTPLSQALLQAERAAVLREVRRELRALEVQTERALGEVRALDGQWAARSPETLAGLAALQQELAYLARWEGQLREAHFQLEAGGAAG